MEMVKWEDVDRLLKGKMSPHQRAEEIFLINGSSSSSNEDVMQVLPGTATFEAAARRIIRHVYCRNLESVRRGILTTAEREYPTRMGNSFNHSTSEAQRRFLGVSVMELGAGEGIFGQTLDSFTGERANLRRQVKKLIKVYTDFDAHMARTIGLSAVNSGHLESTVRNSLASLCAFSPQVFVVFSKEDYSIRIAVIVSDIECAKVRFPPFIIDLSLSGLSSQGFTPEWRTHGWSLLPIRNYEDGRETGQVYMSEGRDHHFCVEPQTGLINSMLKQGEIFGIFRVLKQVLNNPKGLGGYVNPDSFRSVTKDEILNGVVADPDCTRKEFVYDSRRKSDRQSCPKRSWGGFLKEHGVRIPSYFWRPSTEAVCDEVGDQIRKLFDGYPNRTADEELLLTCIGDVETQRREAAIEASLRAEREVLNKTKGFTNGAAGTSTSSSGPPTDGLSSSLEGALERLRTEGRQEVPDAIQAQVQDAATETSDPVEHAESVSPQGPTTSDLSFYDIYFDHLGRRTQGPGGPLLIPNDPPLTLAGLEWERQIHNNNNRIANPMPFPDLPTPEERPEREDGGPSFVPQFPVEDTISRSNREATTREAPRHSDDTRTGRTVPARRRLVGGRFINVPDEPPIEDATLSSSDSE